MSIGGLELKKTSVESLPGFETDKVGYALLAFEKSCKKIVKKKLNARFGGQAYTGLVKDWVNICSSLPTAGSEGTKYREYLIQKFRAYKIFDPGNP